MAASKVNIQDTILNELRKTKTPATVFLVNGKPLHNAQVISFDAYSVLFSVPVETPNKKFFQQQLIYKHAMTTIIPKRPLNLNFTNDQQQ